MARETKISGFIKIIAGIAFEIFTTFLIMAVIFTIGFFVLRLFSK